MRAASFLLKTTRSEVHYRGNYTEIAFGLLSQPPAVLYRPLLKHLGVFGANLQSLKAETPSLADSQITCVLPDLNTGIHIRLDRFEVDFWRLHEIGAETSNRLLVATWSALNEADTSMKLASHVVDLNILAEIDGGTCTDLMREYVRTPEALGSMEVGVAFYTPPIQSYEQPWINVVIDRVFRQDKQLLLKMTFGLNANMVGLDAVAAEIEAKSNMTLKNLGLHFETADEQRCHN